jgi:2-hydroxy-6-oxonona-2,4-dienedioate hydrolase
MLVAGVALVGALVAQWLFEFRRDLVEAEARVSIGSQLAQTPCGPIEFADAGNGPPLLIVHGAGGGFDQGLAFGRPLIDAGFRVIAPSRFGYLRTPYPTNASPMTQADAHACLLDAINLPKVIVLGGSVGAPSTMQLCLRHPGRCSAIVLVVPLAFAPQPEAAPRPRASAVTQLVIETTLKSDLIFWTALKLAPETMVATILATPRKVFRRASRVEQTLVLGVLRDVLPVSRRIQGLVGDAMIGPSLQRYDLERIAVPTLVISAEDDLYGTFNPARYTADHIPVHGFSAIRPAVTYWSNVSTNCGKR